MLDPGALSIRPVPVSRKDVTDILLRHQAAMRAGSAAESCHVFSPDQLSREAVSLFGAFEQDTLVAVGGVHMLDATHAELKSMHVVQAARGRGISRALLAGLLEHAQALGAIRVSLETGAQSSFLPARRLYASTGFKECPAFGHYVEDPASVFMTLSLV